MRPGRSPLLAGALLWTVAAAGALPEGNIKLVVPFSAGSPNDLAGRAIAAKLDTLWGRRVLVENRVGGDAIVGTQSVVGQKPDGRTLLFVTGTHMLNAALRKSLPYDTVRDFSPIGQFGQTQFAIAAGAAQPFRTLAELVAHAKANPGKLTYATTSPGPYLLSELLRREAGIEMLHVPYNASGKAVLDLVAGRIDLLFSAPLVAEPYEKSGQLRILVMSAARRSPDLAHYPVLAESFPKVHSVSPVGLVGPAGLAPALADELGAGLREATRDAELTASLRGIGYETVYADRAAFGALIKSEIDRWRQVVRENNLVPR